MEENLDSLKEENSKLYDKYLRALADYDNLMKMSSKRMSDYALARDKEVAKRLLPLADAFSIYYANQDNMSDEDLKVVFNNIKLEYEQLISSMGIVEIDPVGEKFNEHLHDAIMVSNDESIEDNIITQTITKGYSCNGILLRHPQVAVNKIEKN